MVRVRLRLRVRRAVTWLGSGSGSGSGSGFGFGFGFGLVRHAVTAILATAAAAVPSGVVPSEEQLLALLG